MNAFSEIRAAIPVYDIAPKSQLVFDGLTYVHLERQAAGHTIKQLTADAPIETLTHEHLHDLFRSGQIVISDPDRRSRRNQRDLPTRKAAQHRDG